MPTKEETIDRIDKEGKPTYSAAQVKHYVMGVKSSFNVPDTIKKGDIFTMFGGTKSRPFVVIKVVKSVVYCIPLSTTENELNLFKISSRFTGDEFFTRGIMCATLQYVKDNFTGVLDNNKALNQAIKQMKGIVNSL